MPQDAIDDVSAQLLVIGIGELVVHDMARTPLPRARAISSSSSCNRSTEGFSMSTCLPAARASRAGSKWRSSGVATQTASTPWASIWLDGVGFLARGEDGQTVAGVFLEVPAAHAVRLATADQLDVHRAESRR